MKLLYRSLLAMLIISWLSFYHIDLVHADWWQRPPARDRIIPTRPLTDRAGEPEPTEQVSPTSSPLPTTPVGGPPTATNTPPPTTSEGGKKDEGKKDEVKQETAPAPSQEEKAEVKGLSKTAGAFGSSDIMLISGLLCLLLYVRSKLFPRLVKEN